MKDSWKAVTVVMIEGVLSVALVMAGGTIFAAGADLRATTLRTARNWSLAAVLLWLAALVASWMTARPSAAAEMLWFTTTLVSLCPPIAVLGARHPGLRAWNWFVLAPLLAVLGWPALTAWATGAPLTSLHVETPQLIGIAFVLLMGAGNYVGTKFWASACLYVVAICLLVAPLSPAGPEWLAPQTARLAATAAIALAAIAAWLKRNSGDPVSPSLDRLWADYRNAYGMVWSRRLQDRLNAVAHQHNWPVRAAPSGLEWDEDVTPERRREIAVPLQQSLRWMLRRFVESDWIDQRLSDGSGN